MSSQSLIAPSEINFWRRNLLNCNVQQMSESSEDAGTDLEISELQSCPCLGHHFTGLGQRLGCLLFPLGCDDLTWRSLDDKLRPYTSHPTPHTS